MGWRMCARSLTTRSARARCGRCVLAIPTGYRLLRVEGEMIRAWELKPAQGAKPDEPAGEEWLVVDLAKG